MKRLIVGLVLVLVMGTMFLAAPATADEAPPGDEATAQVDSEPEEQKAEEQKAEEAPEPAPEVKAPDPAPEPAPEVKAPEPAPEVKAPDPAPVKDDPAPAEKAKKVEAANIAPVVDDEKKIFVCKYVTKPGGPERLKAGKNPIEVGDPSADGTAVGSSFNDAQGRSLVVASADSACPGSETQEEEVPNPTPPPTIDPCGPDNATYTGAASPSNDYTYDYDNDGNASAIAVDGKRFENGETVVNFGKAADSGDLCEEEGTVVPNPTPPPSTDPCGPDNAFYNVPVQQPSNDFTYDLTEEGPAGEAFAIAAEGVVFADGSTRIAFGTADDSGVACPTDDDDDDSDESDSDDSDDSSDSSDSNDSNDADTKTVFVESQSDGDLPDTGAPNMTLGALGALLVAAGAAAVATGRKTAEESGVLIQARRHPIASAGSGTTAPSYSSTLPPRVKDMEEPALLGAVTGIRKGLRRPLAAVRSLVRRGRG